MVYKGEDYYTLHKYAKIKQIIDFIGKTALFASKLKKISKKIFKLKYLISNSSRSLNMSSKFAYTWEGVSEFFEKKNIKNNKKYDENRIIVLRKCGYAEDTSWPQCTAWAFS